MAMEEDLRIGLKDVDQQLRNCKELPLFCCIEDNSASSYGGKNLVVDYC